MITYKQIEQIEKYLVQVNKLREQKTYVSKELYETSKNLDERIRASSIGYSPIINWNNCLVVYSARNISFNSATIKSNLMVMQAALEGILNSIPYYSEIVAIRKDIARGRKIVVNEEKQAFVCLLYTSDAADE